MSDITPHQHGAGPICEACFRHGLDVGLDQIRPDLERSARFLTLTVAFADVIKDQSEIANAVYFADRITDAAAKYKAEMLA